MRSLAADADYLKISLAAEDGRAQDSLVSSFY
jgi:hypothetical protein